MEKSSDEQLMAFIRNKNTRAFQILFKRYEVAIYNFIFRYTNSAVIAQDLLQETFTRLWFAAHLFRQKEGTFKGWLYTIAINIVRNEMSKKRYDYHYLDISEAKGGAEPIHPEKDQPDSKVENLDLRKNLLAALAKLKPLYREIVIMKNFQELKFREIAEITKTPESTLKARFQRAIAQLRTELEPLEL